MILKSIKIIKNYVCQVLNFRSYIAQCSVIVRGSMLLGIHV
jgi:hypothetical protein